MAMRSVVGMVKALPRRVVAAFKDPPPPADLPLDPDAWKEMRMRRFDAADRRRWLMNAVGVGAVFYATTRAINNAVAKW